MSIKQLTNKRWVSSITMLDAFWVLGSLIIVLFGLFNLSQNGYILMSVVAVWIAFLAYNQFKNNQ